MLGCTQAQMANLLGITVRGYRNYDLLTIIESNYSAFQNKRFRLFMVRINFHPTQSILLPQLTNILYDIIEILHYIDYKMQD